MKIAINTIIFAILLSGCVPNYVSMTEFYNTVEMILPDGTVYKGKVTFDYSKKDGVIEFKNTPYGVLQGNFATVNKGFSNQSSGAAFGVNNNGNAMVVPVIANQSVESNLNYGNAYLKSNNKVVLRCALNLNFPVDHLRGGAYAIGQGSCYDNKKEIILLQFIHSI